MFHIITVSVERFYFLSGTMWRISSVIFCVNLLQVTATFSETANFPTDKGDIFGLEDSNTGVKKFLGIPYAKPPTGGLRFKDPELPDAWTNPLNCTVVKDQCPQNPCLDGLGCIPNSPGNEDCLYLNIYLPNATFPNSSKPVAVFLHGGAFELGTGGSKLYDGTNMATIGDIIVVTCNFRLGVLGSLVFNGSDEATTGNYFIKDQRLVFQWIQNNIHNFGGDPNKVTCFGQSSGAQACAVHSYTVKSRGLFLRAFYMSFPAAIFTRNTAQMQKRGNAIAQHLSCTTVDCLRQKNANQFPPAGNVANSGSNDLMSFFQPNTVHEDGTDVTESYVKASADKLFDHCLDYMISFTTGETVKETVGNSPNGLTFSSYLGLLFYWRGCLQCSDVDSFADLSMNIATKCPGFANLNVYQLVGLLLQCDNMLELIVKYTSCPSCTDFRPDAANVTADFIYKCPIRYISNKLAPKSRVWVAQFDQPAPATANDPCTKISCHALDLLYYFKTFDYYPLFNNVTTQDRELADAMICYFANFVRWGNPNKDLYCTPICKSINLVPWKEFTAINTRQIVYTTKGQGIFLDKNKQSNSQFSKCSFWDGVGYDPVRN